MITTTVSFRVTTGKNAEALEHFQSVARLAKKLSGADLRILTQLGGPIGHFVLVGTYENLAAYEEARTKLTSDPAFQKLQIQAGELNLFVPATTESANYKQV
jgi:quinol monooxygenase YgiN